MKERYLSVSFVAFAFVVVALMAVDVVARFGWCSIGGWKQCVVWSAFFLAPTFVFGRLSRYLYLPVMCYVFVIEVVNIYILCTFHMSIGGDWLMIAMNSNKAEVINFLHGMLDISSIALVSSSLTLLIGVCVLIWKTRFPVLHVWSPVVAILLLIPIVVFNVIGVQWRDGLFCMNFTHIIRQTKRSHDSFSGLMRAVNHPTLPDRLSLSTRDERPPLGVIIIGESATRNHWGLYGYKKRDTTPCLNSISNELYVFRDVVGCWSATADACRYLLTDTVIENERLASCTLPDVYRRAGYDCVFYTMSPEPGTGYYDVLDALFKTCSTNVYLNGRDILHPRLDDMIIPLFRKEVRARRDESRPSILFFQLGGCHYPYERWYPSDENVFGAGDGDSVIHYDNAVRFDDRVIAEMLQIVKQENRSAFVFYISDHGETPDSGHWRLFPDRDLWELPMFIWCSPQYAEAYPAVVERIAAAVNLPLQSDQLFFGLVALARVNGRDIPSYTTKLDFLSSDFTVREERLVLKKKFVYRKDGGRMLK